MKESHWLLLLLIVAFVAFAPALRNGLNGDDHVLLEGRADLMNSSGGLKQILTHSFWWGTNAADSKEHLFRPWVSFTYWFEFHLGHGRVWVYHLSNLLVHLANIALLFVFLRPIMSFWPALLVAAYAGLSPAAVSTVGWASERTALWAQLFTLVFLICFRRARTDDRRRGLWLTTSMASYFLAMSSMEMAVSAPILAALFDWASPPQKLPAKKNSLRYLWLGIPIGLWIGLRAAAGISPGAGNLGHLFALSFQFLPEQYLRTFWSAIVSPHFVYEDDLLWSKIGHQGILFYIGWLVFTGLILLIFYGIRKRRLWAVGGLWFGLMLFPVYAFGQSFAPLSDFYSYAALPGIGLFLVDGIRELWQRYVSRGAIPRFATFLIAAVLVLYGIQSFARVPLVTDDRTLWTHMLKVRPHYIRALATVSEFSFQDGDPAHGFDLLGQAVAADSTDIEVRTRYIGKSLVLNRPDLAQPHVAVLERIGANSFLALVWVAKYYLETGDCAKAIEFYHRAEPYHAPTPDILFDYGRAFLCVNDYESALQSYQMALELRPDWAAAYHNLGVSYENLGQNAQALEAYKMAARLSPGSAITWRALAVAAARQGDSQTAQNAIQQFLNLHPPQEQIDALNRELASMGLSFQISPTP